MATGKIKTHSISFKYNSFHAFPHPSGHMLRHSYTPQTTDDHMNWKVPWELATPIIPGYQASKRAGILHNQSCRQLSVELLNEYFSSH